MSDTAQSTPSTASSLHLHFPTPIHAKFDFTDSDITLLSSDGVLFRVHRANLAAFSAVFKNMFTDGQAQSEPVSVSETSGTLEILLAMCYPSEDPPVDFTTVEAKVILACYEAAVKYQMWVAGLALRSFVQPLVNLEPFLVVKLAYRLNDSVLMKAAAEEALKCDILANAGDYAEKAGPDMWPRLLEFHYRRKMELVDFAFSQLGNNVSPCNYCGRDQLKKQLMKEMLTSRSALPDHSAVERFNSSLRSLQPCAYCAHYNFNYVELQDKLANFPSTCSFTSMT